MVDRVSVVRSRRDQLFDHGRDAGSATLPELRTFPVVGVVSLFVEDKTYRKPFRTGFS